MLTFKTSRCYFPSWSLCSLPQFVVTNMFDINWGYHEIKYLKIYWRVQMVIVYCIFSKILNDFSEIYWVALQLNTYCSFIGFLLETHSALVCQCRNIIKKVMRTQFAFFYLKKSKWEIIQNFETISTINNLI